MENKYTTVKEKYIYWALADLAESIYPNRPPSSFELLCMKLGYKSYTDFEQQWQNYWKEQAESYEGVYP